MLDVLQQNPLKYGFNGTEVLIITHNVIIFIAADIYEQELTAGEFLTTYYFEEKYTLVYTQLAEPEPTDLQWLGQKTGLDHNLLKCHGATSLPVLWSLGIHSSIITQLARMLIIINIAQYSYAQAVKYKD